MLDAVSVAHVGFIQAWSFGWQEALIILVVLLLLFGGRKLPELARGLAKSLRIFKSEMRGVKEDVEDAVRDEPDTGERKTLDSKPADSKPPENKSNEPPTG